MHTAPGSPVAFESHSLSAGSVTMVGGLVEGPTAGGVAMEGCLSARVTALGMAALPYPRHDVRSTGVMHTVTPSLANKSRTDREGWTTRN